ncbi:hypothetical protein H0H93_010285, partial [Arthromyces matolae]
MQMTIYVVIVYLLIHGLVPNYRVIATAAELGTRSSHDMPQIEGPPTGQASGRLKELESECDSLVNQLNEVKAQKQSPARAKDMEALGHQIRRRRREISAITMNLPAIPRNLVDRTHLPGGHQETKSKNSLRRQQTRNVENLRRQRDSEQNREQRSLLQKQLNAARRRLKDGKYEDAVVKNIEAGKDPADLPHKKTCAEKLEEMEAELKQEKDQRNKRNLRKRITRLKEKIDKLKAMERKEGKSADEKVDADELQLG